LPIRVSLDLAPDAGEVPAWIRSEALATPQGHVVLVRDDAKKMDLLREAASDPRVTNIEIAAPTLDDLYAHFLRTQEKAA
jgi:Cu-processing system ATP-binding protein